MKFKEPETKHVEAFVVGLYVLHTKGIPQHQDGFGNVYPYTEPYFRDCLNKTHRYILGTQTLDASCSDFQCVLAHEAAKVFGRKTK